MDEYFGKIVSKSITDYKAIRLIKLVDVLKEEFNIDLSNIEIFCLFTKVKPNLGASKDPDDIEEIIDYSKLKEEIENYLRHPSNKEEQKNNEISQKSEKKNNKGNKKEKLDYSNLLEHAPKESFSSEKFDLRKILINFMDKHKFSFERFIFPVHCMMKLTSNNKRFNRYIDVEFFKHFLYQNGILIQSANLMEYIGGNNLLYNNEKINIDYLKYIINEDGNHNDKLKESDFMVYKPIKETLKVSNIKGKENLKKDDISFGD